MCRAAILLPALLLIACEPSPQASPGEQGKQAEVTASPASERPLPEPAQPVADGPPAPPSIPGLLLARLEIEREGSFTLPEDTDELEPRAAVVLGRGLALVGQAHARGQSWGWVGFEDASVKLDSGSISAAISDGKGGALLAGEVAAGSDARAWFGALNAKGAVTKKLELDGETSGPLVDLLAGYDADERALVLGNLDGQGWVVSLGSRGAVRWQRPVSSSGSTQIHAAARVRSERGEVLAIGTRTQGAGASESSESSESWWSTLAGPDDADTQLEQGKFEIEGADPIQVLEAIVDLGDNMGFLALGRARREPVQDHDQVIAVGFDRAGKPTWSRVLDHFRASEIYGGGVNPELPGIANFVVRVPIGGGEGRSALGWLDICPGVDGIVIPRQLAGTEGWASAGFIEGREGLPAILTYRQTETGVDWRVLPLDTSYRVGAPQ